MGSREGTTRASSCEESGDGLATSSTWTGKPS
jgi:hypothetical protein